MRGFSRSELLTGAALVLPSTFGVQPAWAQDGTAASATPTPGGATASAAATQVASDTSSGDAQRVDDIIVTANKREERLNKVGQTVIAITGQTLAERKITTLSTIAAVVPGLTFAQSDSNTPILTLRGVGSIQMRSARTPPSAFIPIRSRCLFPCLHRTQLTIWNVSKCSRVHKAPSSARMPPVAQSI